MTIECNTAHVATEGLVYVVMKSREEFDLLRATATDHGQDAQGGHVLTKTVESDDVMVIFQYWVKRRQLEASR